MGSARGIEAVLYARGNARGTPGAGSLALFHPGLLFCRRAIRPARQGYTKRAEQLLHAHAALVGTVGGREPRCHVAECDDAALGVVDVERGEYGGELGRGELSVAEARKESAQRHRVEMYVRTPRGSSARPGMARGGAARA